jgi:enoyl-CoA hydratase
MASCEYLTLSEVDGVATVTLNRPPANAISLDLMGELVAVSRGLEQRASTRVAVIRSDVPGMFMAGADLKVIAGRLDRLPQVASVLRRALDTWERLPFPTIAEIGGHALGGGCELSLVCDFRVMSRGKGRIGLPEMRRGLLASAGGTQRLVRLLGRARASDLVLRGRLLDAEEAAAIGLVTRACDPDELRTTVDKLAGEFLAYAPLTLAAAKRVIREGSELPLSAGLTLESSEMILLADTHDVREGIAAFIEKREPHFIGR